MTGLLALILTANPSLPAQEVAAHMLKLEAQGGARAHILYGVAWVETGGTLNPRTRGRAGEVGLFQIHPCHKPPRGWTAQMDWASAHLIMLKRRYGSWEVALAAYNGGPGGRHKAVCRRYAKTVLGKARQVR